MNFKLFCFPYAGGSSMIYRNWKQYLSPEIELVPIELAGRGTRILEKSYLNIEQAVQDLFDIMKSDILKGRYALFGHSLGALLCYELCKKIQKEKFPNPDHVFFSARNAPHIERDDINKYHLMSDDDFKANLISMGGTPPELFEHKEFMDLFVPLIKNDFKLSEQKIAKDTNIPLDSAITILTGKRDALVYRVDEWLKYSTRNCNIILFEGGHFFINEEAEKIIRVINRTLLVRHY